MFDLTGDLGQRAQLFATRRGTLLDSQLGLGRDGSVYSTFIPTAVKIHRRRESYHREKSCYIRLTKHRVTDVLGHRVPCLVSFDDGLLAIEMSIVSPPFLLDFGSAYLDTSPDFSDEVLAEWMAEKREQFGAQWDRVQLVMAFLKGNYDIHLTDVNPGNITFG